MSGEGKVFAKAHAAAVADLRARQAGARAELRKNEIADTATRLFADRGYHQTAIGDIARAVAIGHGTVYRYFDNKRDILDQILDNLAGRLFAAATSENAPDAATTIGQYRKQVEHFARAFWGLFDSDPAIRMLLRQADSVDPELSVRVSDFITMASALVAGYLENGRAREFVRDDIDPQATARAVVGLVVGSMLCIREDDGNARERYTDAALELMFNGVAADRSPK